MNSARNIAERLRLLLALAGLLAQADSVFSVIIPANRCVNWSYDVVGVPGGIPNRTNIFTTVPAGSTDAQIQSAINSCPSNKVVQLAPGSFVLSNSVNLGFHSGITLRGSVNPDGSPATYLTNYASSSQAAISVGANVLWNNNNDPAMFDAGITITSGCTKDSSNVVVSSTSGLSPGMVILINQINDTNTVFDSTGTSPRAMGQTVHLEAVNGNILTIWPPLVVDFSTNLDARVKTLGGPNYQINFSGVENVVVVGGGATIGIMVQQAYGCWLKNVVTTNVPNYHVMVYASAQCSFIHCTCQAVPVHGPNHFGIGLEQSVGCCLIENCILYGIFPGIEINYGSSGNVIAYNYIQDSYQDGFGQGCGLDLNHGPHNVMNLAEGNIVNMIQSDGYWGSSGYDTIFRNAASGWTPTYSNVNSKCICMNRWARNANIVGNVLGDLRAGQHYETTNSGDGNPTIYEFGFPNMGNSSYNGTAPPNIWHNPGSGSGDNQYRDLLAASTAIVDGNYDVVTRAVTWSTYTDHTIPNSLYLTSKPIWFGDRPWPPVDPFHPDIAVMTNIPAGYRFVFGTDPPPYLPTLAIQQINPESIQVSWPSPFTGWTLWQSADLGASGWTSNSTSVSNDSTNKSITIASPLGNQFFRLNSP